MEIILDNGHGSNTAGKRSPIWEDGTQLFEYEFNRDIVARILKAIPNAHILVPELIDISLTQRYIRANALAKRYGFKNCLLISIHGNAAENQKANGWEVFTSIGQTASDYYATQLYHEAEKRLFGWSMRKEMYDGDVDKEADFTILKSTLCAAILSENGFYTNEQQCKFMMSNAGRQTIADIHINFIKSIK